MPSYSKMKVPKDGKPPKDDTRQPTSRQDGKSRFVGWGFTGVEVP